MLSSLFLLIQLRTSSCLPPPQVELLCRVATLLVRLHMSQMQATPSARPLLIQLQTLLRQRMQVGLCGMGCALSSRARQRANVTCLRDTHCSVLGRAGGAAQAQHQALPAALRYALRRGSRM